MTDRSNQKNKPSEGGSRILRTVNRTSSWLYRAFRTGFLGRILTAYDREEAAVSSGLGGMFRRIGNRFRRLGARTRKRVSGVFESSRVLRWIHSLRDHVLSCQVHVFGIFFALYGCYLLMEHFLFHLPDGFFSAYFISGALAVTVALPMFFSGEDVSSVLLRSRMMRWFLLDVCGINEGNLQPNRQTARGLFPYVTAVSAAILGGLISYFMTPVFLPLVLGGLLVTVLLFVQPEIGAVLLLFVFPFMAFAKHATAWAIALVVVTMLAFLGKVLCGKRVWRFGLLDGMVLFFALLTLLGGVVTTGGIASFSDAGIRFMMICGYFLIANLAHTSVWQERCVGALFLSGTLIALVGVLAYLFPEWVSNPLVDQLTFTGMGTRILAAFENDNVMGVFLVMMVPVSLAVATRQSTRSGKMGTYFCFILILICTVLSWSLGALIGVGVALVLMLLLFHPKVLTAVLVAALPVGVGGWYLWDAVKGTEPVVAFGRQIMAIGDLTGAASLSRGYVWEGTERVIREYWVSGIGVGSSAFGEVYPLYAMSGMESVTHGQSLYFQILTELGVVGLVVFAVVIFLLCQKCLCTLSGTHTKKGPIIVAGFCGVVGMLVMGVWDSIWYHESICFLFWALIGLVSACVRTEKEDRERAFLPTEDSSTASDCTVSF